MNAEDCLALVRWYAEQNLNFETARVAKAMAVEHAANPMPVDKANRWLGYVQGVLSTRHYYSVDDLRAHIREQVWK